ncbi:MAG: (2Fe-2S)-binding protein [Planctomycetota bacterium]|jgi:carbon-monoxide dehydrogenase small subunit
MKQLIKLQVNGVEEEAMIEPWWNLARVLRDELNLTGTKIGCGTGDCGSCTVLVDGKAVKSCLYLAMKARGKDILTIEGLRGEDGELHPLQKAFIDYFAIQCGYCTPGMIMTAKALLDENPGPSEDEVKKGLDGNLCRCTGYVKIIEAVRAVAAK